MTLSGAEVARLLAEHGISPSRALGQNFVADPNTVRRVARLAEVGPGSQVVEVGAGLGSLTLALAETGASVTAVERDRRLVPVLREVLAERAPAARVRVVEADAMTLDWDALLCTGGKEAAPGTPGPPRTPRMPKTPVRTGAPGWALVANLPYNVATPLVADLLDNVPAIERMVFMVQAEVAQRLVAEAGSRAYGAISVKVTYWARATLLGTVPSSVFVPRPKVASALVSVHRRAQPAVNPDIVGPAELFGVVRAGFAQRRKMLRGALAAMGATPATFAAAGVNEQARAEELSVEAWGRLAAAVHAMAPARTAATGSGGKAP